MTFNKLPARISELPKSQQVILLRSSKINNEIFPPWTPDDKKMMADGLQHEAGLFSDPSGFLKLSDTQKQLFESWRRASDIWGSEMQLFDAGNYDLTQDLLPDCSVIASLCSISRMEFLSGKTLLSKIIYPGTVSKSGKYVIKLFINGVIRKVIIDDYLPHSSGDRHLHVVSKSNPRLAWPALLEKAYLRVMGGYDFPGSNAATDVFSFTGWIPEHISLHLDDVIVSSLWNRLFNAWKYHDVIVTLGTGDMSVDEEHVFGLVGNHDYAVLDFRMRDDSKEVLVKNPWSCHVNQDDSNNQASDINSGFHDSLWIEFSTVCLRFNSLYLNWNPALFSFKYQTHFSYDPTQTIIKNSLDGNPQFCLKNLDSEKSASVWVVLVRHTSSKLDRSRYISLNAFNSCGEKLLIRRAPSAKTKLVDSPQTLLKLDQASNSSATLVVLAQGDQMPVTNFSLLLYSTRPLDITPAKFPFQFTTAVSAQWTELSAGGNPTSPYYSCNPQFKLLISNNTKLRIYVESADSGPLHARMLWSGGKRILKATQRDSVADTGEYQIACAMSRVVTLSPGIYTIVASQYEVGRQGTFKLKVMTDVSCDLVRLADDTSIKPPPR
ncbi:hypothetical protein V1514DRAFT_353987 [Lipomyces japonicus]|uniref:uncharacterized protein n=1 Tax=Lipomyces japonicus TaxID=56871 RepID=UPI0034CD7942